MATACSEPAPVTQELDSSKPVDPTGVAIGPCTHALLHKIASAQRSSMAVFDPGSSLGEKRFNCIMQAASAVESGAATALRGACLRAIYVEATLFKLVTGDVHIIKTEAATRGAAAEALGESVTGLVTRYEAATGLTWIPFPRPRGGIAYGSISATQL